MMNRYRYRETIAPTRHVIIRPYPKLVGVGSGVPVYIIRKRGIEVLRVDAPQVIASVFEMEISS
jgi:hypothetical protein